MLVLEHRFEKVRSFLGVKRLLISKEIIANAGNRIILIINRIILEDRILLIIHNIASRNLSIS